MLIDPTNANASEGELGAGSLARRRRYEHILALILVTVASRLPLLGLGDADSALFTIGLRQWVKYGAQGQEIYSAKACAVYYWLCTIMVRALGIPESDFVSFLSIVSALASIGIAIITYLIASKVNPGKPAFWSTVILMLSPGMWLVSIEPHPLSLSIFMTFLGVLLFVKHLDSDRYVLLATSGIVLGIAVGVKDDAVLTHISNLNHISESSDRPHHQYLCGCERDEGAPEVNTQWVRYKISPFSSPSIPHSRSISKVPA